MPKGLLRFLALIAFSLMWLGKTAESQTVVSRHFPGREGTNILCWSIPEERAGYQSQIVVFQTDAQGAAKLLWQSPIDNSYDPQIRFIEEITAQGLPLALIERQTGAASSQLDVIGKAAGRIVRLVQIDGFKFDVAHLDGSKLPFIIAHTDASVLDVPDIYRWNGGRFVEDSAAHSDYYRQRLAEDKSALPEDSGAAVLVNLARIALLSGDRAEAKAILADALSRERSKGNEANEETLKLIHKALHALEPSRRPQDENPHPKL